MILPFSKQLDDLFSGDRSIWWKILGGAAVAALVVLSTVDRPGPLGVVEIVMALVFTALVGPGAVVLLYFVDEVRHRLEAAQHVNWLLRLYFSGSTASLVMWVVTIILVTVLGITVMLLGM